MKKRFLFNKKMCLSFCLVCLFSLYSESQENVANQKNDFWKNVRYGGGFGLSFGDGYFSGTLAPNAIYQFNNQFALGLGLNATFANQKDIYNSTVFGGSILTLFNPIPDIQFSTEFEELHVSRNFDVDFIDNVDDDYWYPALFFGVGYNTGAITLGIRYDVLYDEDKSVYKDPWSPFFRFYF